MHGHFDICTILVLAIPHYIISGNSRDFNIVCALGFSEMFIETDLKLGLFVIPLNKRSGNIHRG